MPYNLTDAINYALLVQAAAQIDAGDAPTYQLPTGYTLLAPLYANDLATERSPATDYVPFGFVARNGPLLVVALRGTEHIWEWIDDASFLTVPCPVTGGSGRTEDGFSAVYQSLRTDHDDAAPTLVQFLRTVLQAGDSIVACGHSLGAALVTLAAYDIALNISPGLTIYTYASPNVGDGAFASAFNAAVPNAWRVVNPFDVVTHVPLRLILGYQVVGETIAYNPAGQIKTDIACFHHLRSYLHLMSVAAAWPIPIALDPECVTS